MVIRMESFYQQKNLLFKSLLPFFYAPRGLKRYSEWSTDTCIGVRGSRPIRFSVHMHGYEGNLFSGDNSMVVAAIV